MSSLEDPQVSEDLENIAPTLVSDAKGILAADESVKTSTRRFDAVGIQSTEESRRAYREILFTTTGASEFISGAILYDETIRQTSSDGTPFAQVLSSQNILPGIKVDTGAVPLAGSPDETVTEGLDGLRDRLTSYHEMGARFAKWRAVIRITPTLPRSVRSGSSCRSPSRKC
jgi:fructose-bisphosphate aldolase, class I